MPEDTVLKEKNKDGVLTLSLNRPDKLNTYNEELMTSFSDELAAADSDPSVRAVVIKGEGKHFSAGADVSWFKALSQASESEQMQAALLGTSTMRRLNDLSKPTLALVHNACFGGATGFVAACDMAIASEDARFAITEVRIGITPAPILPLIVNAIGARQARRYCLTGETFDAQEAMRIGFVHAVCPVGQLDKAVEPIIDGILKSGPGAVADTKRMIAEVADSHYDTSMAEKMAAKSASGRSTDEGIEGFSAFLDKRSPNWVPK